MNAASGDVPPCARMLPLHLGAPRQPLLPHPPLAARMPLVRVKVQLGTSPLGTPTAKPYPETATLCGEK